MVQECREQTQLANPCNPQPCTLIVEGCREQPQLVKPPDPEPCILHPRPLSDASGT